MKGNDLMKLCTVRWHASSREAERLRAVCCVVIPSILGANPLLLVYDVGASAGVTRKKVNTVIYPSCGIAVWEGESAHVLAAAAFVNL